MTNKEFMAIADQLQESAHNILIAKGNDYAGQGDRLASIKRAAVDLAITPRQAWAVGMLKQVDAVCAWARGEELQSESLDSRLADVINYSLLGKAVAVEEARMGKLDDALSSKPIKIQSPKEYDLSQ
jgi:hypothetical protein